MSDRTDFESIINAQRNSLEFQKKDAEVKKSIDNHKRLTNHALIVRQIRLDAITFCEVARKNRQPPKDELIGTREFWKQVVRSVEPTFWEKILLNKEPRQFTTTETVLDSIHKVGWKLSTRTNKRTVAYETMSRGEITTTVEMGLFLSEQGEIHEYTYDGSVGFSKFNEVRDEDLVRIAQAPVIMEDVTENPHVVEWQKMLLSLIE